MVVCAKALLNVARKLQTDYKTPFFEGSFYGVTDTSMAFREFAKLLNDPQLSERTEALIAREEAKINAALEPWREKLRGKRVLLYTGGVKSWSIVSALQDLGMEVVATGTNKSTEEDKARIREIMGDKTRMITDGSPKALLGAVKEYEADILIAGGRNMYTALKARIPFLDINQEREFGYEGYSGMIELARQLALTIQSPVWDIGAQACAVGEDIRARNRVGGVMREAAQSNSMHSTQSPLPCRERVRERVETGRISVRGFSPSPQPLSRKRARGSLRRSMTWPRY